MLFYVNVQGNHKRAVFLCLLSSHGRGGCLTKGKVTKNQKANRAVKQVGICAEHQTKLALVFIFFSNTLDSKSALFVPSCMKYEYTLMWIFGNFNSML